MNKEMTRFLCAVAALACGASFGAVSTSIGQDSSGCTTLRTDAYWSGGAAPSSTNAAVADTDFVYTLKGIRFPEGAFACQGRSFQFGDATHAATGYSKGGPLTFGNEGLVLVNGTFGNWYGGQETVIHGKVTLDCRGCTSFTLDNGHNTPNTRMCLSGGVSCTNAAFELKLLAWENRGGVTFGGGFTNFCGTVSVGSYAEAKIGASTSAAKVKLTGTSPRVGAATATDVTTIASLSLAKGAELVVRLGGTGAPTAGVLRVTSSLSLPSDARVPIRFDGTLARETDVTDRTLPILVAPKGTLDAAKFTLLDETLGSASNGYLPTLRELTVVSDETEDRLCLVLRRVALYQISSDPSLTSGLSEQWISNWSGHAAGDAWHPDWDYLAVKRTIRTYDTATNTWCTFGGHALVLDNAIIAAKGGCHLTISNLVSRSATFSHWGGSFKDLDVHPYALGGTAYLAGRVRVVEKFSFAADSARSSVVDAELTGSGVIDIVGNRNSNSQDMPTYTEFTAANTNFTGSWYIHAALGVPSTTNRATVIVTGPYALGGALAAFDYKSIQLTHYSTLWAQRDVALTEATRGIWVNGQAQFEVSSNATLAVRVPVTVKGTLHKGGSGNLVLGGTVLFNAGDAQPTAGANLLAVHAGTVQAGVTNGLDGLSVAFDAGAALRVDAAATGDLAQVGFVNTKTAEPFRLAACPDGKVPVQMVLPADFAERPRPCAGAICTVSAAAAQNLGAEAFRLACPPRCRTSVRAVANADGTVTFVGEIAPCGFMILIR